jgi:nicotinamide riboside kinase
VDTPGRLKVAFIGTHGVGKTTLCYDVAALLKRGGWNVDVVKEVARQSPLPINRQTSLPAQIWILMMQVAEEIRSAARHDAVVCDRSVLDNYAYLVLACGRQPSLEPFIESWMKTYDVLFKVPVVGAATPDGVRDVDAGFLNDVDRLVDELLAERAVPHERLSPRQRERWREVVKDVLVGRGALAAGL